MRSMLELAVVDNLVNSLLLQQLKLLLPGIDKFLLLVTGSLNPLPTPAYEKDYQ